MPRLRRTHYTRRKPHQYRLRRFVPYNGPSFQQRCEATGSDDITNVDPIQTDLHETNNSLSGDDAVAVNPSCFAVHAVDIRAFDHVLKPGGILSAWEAVRT